MKKVILLFLIFCFSISIFSIAYADTYLPTSKTNLITYIGDKYINKAYINNKFSIYKMPYFGLYKFPSFINKITKSSSFKVLGDSKVLYKYGIEASASLSMSWDDVFGKKNKINNISCLWSCSAGTVKKITLYWGNYKDIAYAQNHKTINTETFNQKINYTSTDTSLFGRGQVRADCIFEIQSPVDNKIHILHLRCEPTIEKDFFEKIIK